jgi:hypothetical protein
VRDCVSPSFQIAAPQGVLRRLNSRASHPLLFPQALGTMSWMWQCSGSPWAYPALMTATSRAWSAPWWQQQWPSTTWYPTAQTQHHQHRWVWAAGTVAGVLAALCPVPVAVRVPTAACCFVPAARTPQGPAHTLYHNQRGPPSHTPVVYANLRHPLLTLLLSLACISAHTPTRRSVPSFWT